MATFKQQIEALAGSSAGTQAEHWLSDGIKAVVDRVVVYNPEAAYLFAGETESSYALGTVSVANGDGGSITASSGVTIQNTGYTYVNGKTTTAISQKVTVKIGTSTVAVLEAGESVTLEESNATYSLSTANDPNANPTANYQIAVEYWTITGNDGLPISELDKVLSVSRGSRVATEIPPAQRFKAADTGSLQRASSEYPYYYKLNGKLYCLPAPDTNNLLKVSKVVYGQVSNYQSGTSTIANFPSGLWRLPVLYSAAKVLNEKLVGYQGLTSNTLSLPSLPTKPALELSVAEALSNVDTSKLSISMPEYVSVADPIITALDLSSITMDAAPEEPTFIYEDASLQEAFSDIAVNLQSSPPQYVPPAMRAPDFSTVDTLIGTDEDIELAGVKIQEISAQISEFSTEMQSSLNAFNKENAEYQVKFQEAVKDFDGKLNKRLETMRQSTSVDLQNKAQRVQTQSGLYSARLQQYGTKLQEFQANINKEVQLYTLNELQHKFAKWQTDVSTNINAYQARVGAAVQSHAAEISSMSAITQTEAAHLGAKLQRESLRNTTKLNDYASRINEYAQSSQVEIARFNALMQEAQVQYRWYERQLAVVKEEYERGFEPFIRRDNNAQQ